MGTILFSPLSYFWRMIYKFVAANILLWHVICALAQFEISAGFGADMKKQTNKKPEQ